MSLIHSIKWIGLSQLIKITAQIVSIFYLTRLISPEEYGLLAMTTIVMNLAYIFSDMGTGAAIVQKQNISINFYSFIYRLNIIIGIIVMLFIFLFTPIIVNYFERDELFNLLYLIALVFPIACLGIVHKSKIEKEQKFKTLAKIEIFANVSGVLVAILLANMGFGVYSIVFQILLVALLTTVLYKSNSKLKLKLMQKSNREDFNHFLSFSGNLFLFNLINYFSRNLDMMLIGKFFSASILGAYSVAYRIMLFPVQSMTFVVSRALLPHMANDLLNIEKIKRSYLKCIFLITMISSPLMLGMSALSNDFVSLFFTENWNYLSIILVWLAPSAIIQCVLSTSGAVFTAYEKTNWLFYLGCISTLLYTSAFYIGVQYNIEVFVKLYLMANVLNFLPVMLLVGKILNFSLNEVIFNILKVMIPAIIMFVFLKILNQYFDGISFYYFSIKILSGILVYLAFLYTFNIQMFQEFFIKINQSRK